MEQPVLILVALLAPLLAMMSPVRVRHGMLSATLFLLATASCVIAGRSPAEVSGDYAGPTFAMLHPVLLAGALSNGAPRAQRHPSTWHGVFPSRTSLLGLWLGMPMVSWLASMVSSPEVFRVAALLTVVTGAGLLMRDGVVSTPRVLDREVRERDEGPGSVRDPFGLVGPLLAIALQYAAMFSVFSHAHVYLESGGDLDAAAVSFLLVVFGIGGVFGAFALGRWMTHMPRTVTCLHPMALAASFLLLNLFARNSGMSSFAVVFVWGAVHTTGMLLTRLLLGQLAHRRRDTAAALHITVAAGGALVGVALANGLGRAYGPEAFVLCGSLLSFAAFVVISLQISREARVPAIVSRSRTE